MDELLYDCLLHKSIHTFVRYHRHAPAYRQEPSSTTTLFLLYPLSITTSDPSRHLPLSPLLSSMELLTDTGGGRLISPVALTALPRAVTVTRRCSTPSAAKDGRSSRGNYQRKYPRSRVNSMKPLKHHWK